MANATRDARPIRPFSMHPIPAGSRHARHHPDPNGRQMLLTLTTTHWPATDLGYLLFKNPARTQSFSLGFGQAHVFYPEAATERCTAALLLDVDPVGLVRGRAAGAPAEQYVNDRPYVASSFLSVAIAQVFGSALGGKSKERPELVETPIPLVARIAVLPCRGGEDLLRRLFEPLGYELSAERHPLDPAFSEWELIVRRYLRHRTRLLRMLLEDRQFEEILGMDVSVRSLEIARDRLRLDELPPKQRERIRLMHGSLMYRDVRIAGFDAAAVVEVIEHLDRPRLRAFERVLWEFARPGTVVLTTPNREYNAAWETLPAGAFRHKDHRFEWTRAEFEAWAEAVAERFGYTVRFLPVGPEDPALGAPTQMGIFVRGQDQSLD